MVDQQRIITHFYSSPNLYNTFLCVQSVSIFVKMLMCRTRHVVNSLVLALALFHI